MTAELHNACHICRARSDAFQRQYYGLIGSTSEHMVDNLPFVMWTLHQIRWRMGQMTKARTSSDRGG